jgi:hypothetical protein
LLHLETWTDSPESFQLDLSEQLAIDPGLIRFRQVAELPLDLNEARAVAAGPEDRIYVAGDRAVHVLGPDGRQKLTIQLEGSPTCLAVGGADHVVPGRVYAGAEGRIELFDATGQPAGIWEGLGDEAMLTSIALAAQDVLVADAANRVVLRLDQDGRITGRIGDRPTGNGSSAFIIPSPYFDVAVSPDGMVHVVNPGARRIETYTPAGELETVWGEAGSDLGRFFGCCNPSHFARLPDGRFVTSEKGIPRIKLYDPQGAFDCVVAGPQQLAVSHAALGDPRSAQGQRVYDVATDSQGRILVLDVAMRSVRIFVSREEGMVRES